MARNKHNTPGIVKFSFWRMTAENLRAVYACVNLGGGRLTRQEKLRIVPSVLMEISARY